MAQEAHFRDAEISLRPAKSQVNGLQMVQFHLQPACVLFDIRATDEDVIQVDHAPGMPESVVAMHRRKITEAAATPKGRHHTIYRSVKVFVVNTAASGGSRGAAGTLGANPGCGRFSLFAGWSGLLHPRKRVHRLRGCCIDGTAVVPAETQLAIDLPKQH